MIKTSQAIFLSSLFFSAFQRPVQSIKQGLCFSSSYVFYANKPSSLMNTFAMISSTILLLSPIHTAIAEDNLQNVSAANAVLESRIERLENQLFEKLHQPEDTLAERIAFTGLLEVEAFQTDGIGENFSDINLATVELAIGAKINNYIDAQLLLLHEEDAAQDIVVDEGFIDFDYHAMRFSAGKQYLPFGYFDSFFISDPLTLEMAETNDTAVTLGYFIDGFYSTAYAFNGDVAVVGEKQA